MNRLWIPAAVAAIAGLAWLALDIPSKAVAPANRPAPAKVTVAKTSSVAPPAFVKSATATDLRPDLERAQNSAPSSSRDAAVRDLLVAWTQRDFSAALAWATQLADPTERQRALETICFDVAQRDPRKAVETAIDSHLCDTDAGALDNLTAQWAARDFASAHAWVQQQEAGDWRDELIARVAFAGSQSDPAAAAQIVAAEMPPGPRQEEAAISVVHQWALRDPDAAAAWANAFPEGDFHKRAMAEIEGIRKSRQTSSDGQ